MSLSVSYYPNVKTLTSLSYFQIIALMLSDDTWIIYTVSCGFTIHSTSMNIAWGKYFIIHHICKGFVLCTNWCECMIVFA